jgi:hypothetical protein
MKSAMSQAYSATTCADGSAGANKLINLILPPTTTGTTGTTTGSVPAPPPPPPQIRATFKLNGDGFDVLLSNANTKSQLMVSVKADLAKLFNVDTAKIIINSLSVGSLLVDFNVETSQSSSSVQSQLNNAQPTAFSNTNSTYKSNGGTSNSLQYSAGSAAANTVVVAPPPSPPATPKTPAGPKSECGSLSGNACMMLLIFIFAMVLIVVGAIIYFVCLRPKKTEGSEPTKDAAGGEEQMSAKGNKESFHGNAHSTAGENPHKEKV